jgi:hypothetical protein
VVGDEDIDASEAIDRAPDQGSAVFWRREFLGKSDAVGRIAFGDKSVGGGLCSAVTERDTRSGLAEEPDGRRAYTA